MNKIIPQTTVKDGRGRIIDLIEGESINAVTYVKFNKNAVRARVAMKGYIASAFFMRSYPQESAIFPSAHALLKNYRPS